MYSYKCRQNISQSEVEFECYCFLIRPSFPIPIVPYPISSIFRCYNQKLSYLSQANRVYEKSHQIKVDTKE